MDKIFIVGRHRSGTSWLANALISHPEVYSPCHEAHNGHHESAFFSSLVRYCNGAIELEDRLALDALFVASDFYKICCDECDIRIEIRDKSASQYFGEFMDTVSLRNGCTAWLEKTPAHTLHLGYLIREFPNAHFVALKRNFVDVVCSDVYGLHKAVSAKSVLSSSFLTAIYEKFIYFYRKDLKIVEYRALEDDFSGCTDNLLSYLGLTNFPIASNAAINSSFSSVRKSIANRYIVIAVIVKYFVALIPAFVVVYFVELHRARTKSSLPHWFFKLYGGK